jgi:hypothetical protein
MFENVSQIMEDNEIGDTFLNEDDIEEGFQLFSHLFILFIIIYIK